MALIYEIYITDILVCIQSIPPGFICNIFISTPVDGILLQFLLGFLSRTCRYFSRWYSWDLFQHFFDDSSFQRLVSVFLKGSLQRFFHWQFLLDKCLLVYRQGFFQRFSPECLISSEILSGIITDFFPGNPLAISPDITFGLFSGTSGSWIRPEFSFSVRNSSQNNFRNCSLDAFRVVLWHFIRDSFIDSLRNSSQDSFWVLSQFISGIRYFLWLLGFLQRFPRDFFGILPVFF